MQRFYHKTFEDVNLYVENLCKISSFDNLRFYVRSDIFHERKHNFRKMFYYMYVVEKSVCKNMERMKSLKTKSTKDRDDFKAMENRIEKKFG